MTPTVVVLFMASVTSAGRNKWVFDRRDPFRFRNALRQRSLPLFTSYADILTSLHGGARLTVAVASEPKTSGRACIDARLVSGENKDRCL